MSIEAKAIQQTDIKLLQFCNEGFLSDCILKYNEIEIK